MNIEDVSEINSEVNLGTNMDEYGMSKWQWKDLNTSWIWRKDCICIEDLNSVMVVQIDRFEASSQLSRLRPQ